MVILNNFIACTFLKRFLYFNGIMNQDLLDLDSAEFALRESFFLIERTQNFIALYYGSVGG